MKRVMGSVWWENEEITNNLFNASVSEHTEFYIEIIDAELDVWILGRKKSNFARTCEFAFSRTSNSHCKLIEVPFSYAEDGKIFPSSYQLA